MMLETMKELFGVTHIRDNEEEVPNAKHMRVAERRSCCHIPSLLQSRRASTRLEEEFLLGPPVTVPPEEDEVPILQGPSVAVPPKEEVLPEEEEFRTSAVTVPHGPSVVVLPEKEEVPAAPPPLVVVPSEGRGCLVPIPTMVVSWPFFFLKNAEDSSRPFFS
jgi:hypothetical protein